MRFSNPDTAKRTHSKIEIDISLPIDSVAAANYEENGNEFYHNNFEDNGNEIHSNIQQQTSEIISSTVDSIVKDDKPKQNTRKRSEGIHLPFSKQVAKQNVKGKKDHQRTLQILSPESINDADEILTTADTVNQSNGKESSLPVSCLVEEQETPQLFDSRKNLSERSPENASSVQQSKIRKVTNSPLQSSPRRPSVSGYSRDIGTRRLNSKDSSRTSQGESQRDKSVSKHESLKSPKKRLPFQNKIQSNSEKVPKSKPPGSPKVSRNQHLPKSKNPLSAVPTLKSNKRTGIQEKRRKSKSAFSHEKSKDSEVSEEIPKRAFEKAVQDSSKNFISPMSQNKSAKSLENVNFEGRAQSQPTSLEEVKQQSPKGETIAVHPSESKEEKLKAPSSSLSQTSVASMYSIYGSSLSGRASRTSDLMLKLTSSEESLRNLDEEANNVLVVLFKSRKILF